jgi:CD2 antigen cytoplasmic tail-binding protein 2
MAGLERRGLTAFDMEEEKDEGHFDAEGNFVWDEDAKKQEDAWMDGVSEQQLGAARSAKSRREFRDAQEEGDTLTTEAAKSALATLLKPRETVLQALKRLGSKKQKRVRPGSKRKHEQRQEPKAQTAEEKQQFEQVTEAADFLMRSGEVEVYSQIREEFVPEEDLLAQRRRVQFATEEAKSEDNPPKQEVVWEYKATDGQIHGPFPTSSFVAWQQQVG